MISHMLLNTVMLGFFFLVWFSCVYYAVLMQISCVQWRLLSSSGYLGGEMLKHEDE